MNRKPNPSPDAATLRRRAEARLRKRQRHQLSKTGNPKSEADTQRLLHELQVHQVELEMQNEELRRAQAQAQTNAGKLSVLYDFAPLGYVSLDEGGRIEQLNFTAAKLLGKPRAALTGTLFVNCVVRLERDIFLRHLRASSQTAAQVTGEVDLCSYDGQTVPAQLCTIYLQDESSQTRHYLTAITERKRLRSSPHSSRDLAFGQIWPVLGARAPRPVRWPSGD